MARYQLEGAVDALAVYTWSYARHEDPPTEWSIDVPTGLTPRQQAILALDTVEERSLTAEGLSDKDLEVRKDGCVILTGTRLDGDLVPQKEWLAFAVKEPGLGKEAVEAVRQEFLDSLPRAP